MSSTNNQSYNLLSKLLHWTVVLLLLAQFTTIWTSQVFFRSGSAFRPSALEMLDLHKALGLAVFAIALLRLLWRWIGGLPDWAPGLAEWEKSAAHKLEMWLYTLLFLIPITGMIYSITSGYPIHFFNLFSIPVLMEKIDLLSKTTWVIHMIVPYLLIAVVAMHIGFVLRRSIYEKDKYISRMWFR